MKRKIVSCVLVSSLLSFIGCYSTGVVTREEVKAKAAQGDITVFTKDSREYKFLKDKYRIQGDTLSGSGVQTIDGIDSPFQGSISFADITSLKTKEFNLGITIFAIGLPVGLGVGLLWFALKLGHSFD